MVEIGSTRRQLPILDRVAGLVSKGGLGWDGQDGGAIISPPRPSPFFSDRASRSAFHTLSQSTWMRTDIHSRDTTAMCAEGEPTELTDLPTWGAHERVSVSRP